MLKLILSPEYAEEIQDRINETKTQPLDYYEPMFEPHSGMSFILIIRFDDSVLWKIMELVMCRSLMLKAML